MKARKRSLRVESAKTYWINGITSFKLVATETNGQSLTLVNTMGDNVINYILSRREAIDLMEDLARSLGCTVTNTVFSIKNDYTDKEIKNGL